MATTAIINHRHTCPPVLLTPLLIYTVVTWYTVYSHVLQPSVTSVTTNWSRPNMNFTEWHKIFIFGPLPHILPYVLFLSLAVSKLQMPPLSPTVTLAVSLSVTTDICVLIVSGRRTLRYVYIRGSCICISYLRANAVVDSLCQRV